MEQTEKCRWREGWEGYGWESECGNVFAVFSGTPAENGMRFCPYCGRHLVEILMEEDEEETCAQTCI